MVRKKKNLLIVFIIALLMVSVLPLNAMAKSDVIPNNDYGIPDKVLYQSILRKLGKNKTETFTKQEVKNITRLKSNNHYDKEKIKSLKGIGNLKNLKYLDVAVNQLTSLAGIEKLTKLETLDASQNNLKTVSEVKNLKDLTKLDVNDNQIKSISEIKNLSKLIYINISRNSIRNLNCFDNLTEIETLYASRNKIKILPNLNNKTKLDSITFQHNFISKKEYNKKIPRKWNKSDAWYKSEVQLQNLVYTIKPIQPSSFNKINKNTKKIVGTAQKGAKIIIRNPTGRKIHAIKSVKADSKGRFTFKNLDLKKWAGKTLSFQSYIIDPYYNEPDTLKTVFFTVGN